MPLFYLMHDKQKTQNFHKHQEKQIHIDYLKFLALVLFIKVEQEQESFDCIYLCLLNLTAGIKRDFRIITFKNIKKKIWFT